MLRRTIVLLISAYRDFTRNNSPYIAAGIAFWMIVCLFPMFLAGLSIVGNAFPAQGQERLIEGITSVIPVSDAYLREGLASVAASRGAAGAVATAALVWTATSVFSAIRKGVNHAWGIARPHYFLLERGIDLALLFGLGAIVVVLGWLSAVLELPAPLFRFVTEFGWFGLTAAVVALLYRYLPNTTISWREVWPGVIVGALFVDCVRLFFLWFVSRASGFDAVYGTMGALVAVLVWAYLSATGLLYGAQVCATHRATSQEDRTSDADGSRQHERAALKPSMLFGILMQWAVPPSLRQPNLRQR
ncbi:MAG: YihY/virulence factor BrkB family protein [Chloroflexi bacterium]|nr:YihY/virulence factor BrkB family protein [Chloroflexota bacterium]